MASSSRKPQDGGKVARMKFDIDYNMDNMEFDEAALEAELDALGDGNTFAANVGGQRGAGVHAAVPSVQGAVSSRAIEADISLANAFGDDHHADFAGMDGVDGDDGDVNFDENDLNDPSLLAQLAWLGGSDGGGSGAALLAGPGQGAAAAPTIGDVRAHVLPPQVPTKQQPVVPAAVTAHVSKLQSTINSVRAEVDRFKAAGSDLKARLFAAELVALQQDVSKLQSGTMTIQAQEANQKARRDAMKQAILAGGTTGSTSAATAAQQVPRPAVSGAAQLQQRQQQPLKSPAQQKAESARFAAYKALDTALKAHYVERVNEFKAIAARERAATGASSSASASSSSPASSGVIGAHGKGTGQLSKADRDARDAAWMKEKKGLEDACTKLQQFLLHPSLPPCPSWHTESTSEVVALTNDDVAPDACEVTFTSLTHLKDKNGKPEKGEVAITYKLPVPVDAEVGGRQPAAGTRKLDDSGSVVDLQPGSGGGAPAGGQLHMIKRSARSTVRAIERKCIFVEIERKSAGAFGLFSKTEVVAKGALPLEGLLAASEVSTIIPLQPPDAPLGIDGYGGSARSRPELTPGYEGPRGGLGVLIRLNTPLRDQPVKVVERKRPVIDSWPALPSSSAAPAAQQPAPAQRVLPAASPAPSAAAPQAASSTTASSLPPPDYASKYPVLAATSIDVYSAKFNPSSVAFYVGSAQLTGPEWERIGALLVKAQERFTQAGNAKSEAEAALARGPPAGVSPGSTAAVEWEGEAQAAIDNAMAAAASARTELLELTDRYTALDTALKAMMEAQQSGKLSMGDYVASLERQKARDIEMTKAVAEVAALGQQAITASAAGGRPLTMSQALASVGLRIAYDPSQGKETIKARAVTLVNELKMMKEMMAQQAQATRT